MFQRLPTKFPMCTYFYEICPARYQFFNFLSVYKVRHLQTMADTFEWLPGHPKDMIVYLEWISRKVLKHGISLVLRYILCSYLSLFYL